VAGAPVHDPGSEAGHLPVMFTPVMDALRIVRDGVYLDGTFGRGGHATGVLERLGPNGRLLLMDKDPQAIAFAERQFGNDPRVAIRRGSFARLDHWAATEAGLDGVLFDLGVSSPQIDEAGRGFSFRGDGPLDMRMDPDGGPSAAEWLAAADESEIAEVLWRLGEERHSRRIARAIVARRAEAAITRTGELARLIAGVVGRGAGRLHPATRSFQAIRIHINRELDELEQGLAAALGRLKAGGRLAVISFHSLEDRRVKRFIREHSRPPPGDRRRPASAPFVADLAEVGAACRADAGEIAANPRARSAVLRVAERLGVTP